MPRKPLIQPGSILPETDTMSRILARDRAKTGRPAPQGEPENVQSETDKETRHIVITQSDSMTDGQDRKPAIWHTDGQTSKPETLSAGKPAGQPRRKRTDNPAPEARLHQVGERPRDRPAGGAQGPLPERVSRATAMAGSPTTTVTLRLPAELNSWLDEYIHRAWPDRVKKQDLVVEALRMLVARRGSAGAPILPTPLLGEEE